MKNHYKDNHLFRSEHDRYSRSPLRNWKITLFILVLITLFGLVARAQSADDLRLPTNDEGSVQFQEVVKIDSTTSARELVGRARTWAAKAYKSANTVVQQYDPEMGVLVIKALMQTTTTMHLKAAFVNTTKPIEHSLNYQITIETKPGRYRVTINNMMLETVTDYSRIGPRTLPARPQQPPSVQVSTGQGAVNKARQAYFEQEQALYANIQDYFNESLADLKKAMRQPGGTVDKKDW